jgi:polysaccharide pyruvyl transferase WcaK-like protein
MISGLRSCLRQIDVLALSFNPAHTSRHHGVKAISNLLPLVAGKLPLLRKSDLFILGGGGLLQDYSSVLNIPHWMSNLNLARRMGIPTMLYGVGVEPIRFAFYRAHVSRALDQVNIVTVRDDESAKLLRSWGTTNEIHTTADPAWGMKYLVERDEGYSHEPQAGREPHDGPVIGISLRQWLDLDSIARYLVPFKSEPRLTGFAACSKANRFLNVAARLADTLVERINARIVVLPVWQTADRPISLSFFERVRHKQQVHLVADQYSPLELVAAIRNMDAFIGTRLHSLLFAAISGTPFIALAYSPKVKALMNQLGYSVRSVDLSTPIDGLESQELVDSLADNIMHMINEREEIDRDLQRRTTALAARSMTNVFHGIDLLTRKV